MVYWRFSYTDYVIKSSYYFIVIAIIIVKVYVIMKTILFLLNTPNYPFDNSPRPIHVL